MKKKCDERRQERRVEKSSPIHGFGKMIVVTTDEISTEKQIDASTMKRVTV